MAPKKKASQQEKRRRDDDSRALRQAQAEKEAARPTVGKLFRGVGTEVQRVLAGSTDFVTFLESGLYLLYLSYGGLALFYVLGEMKRFHDLNSWHPNAELFLGIGLLNYVWLTRLALGNDVQPELSVIRWLQGEISAGQMTRRCLAMLLSGTTVALAIQYFLPFEIIFPAWDREKFGVASCMFIECLFCFPTYGAVSLYFLVNNALASSKAFEIEAEDHLNALRAAGLTSSTPPESPKASKPSPRKCPRETEFQLRGFEELIVVIVAASVCGGMAFTQGGPCINSVYCVMAAFFHRDLEMGIALAAANILAAVIAGFVVRIVKVPKPVKEGEIAKRKQE